MGDGAEIFQVIPRTSYLQGKSSNRFVGFTRCVLFYGQRIFQGLSMTQFLVFKTSVHINFKLNVSDIHFYLVLLFSTCVATILPVTFTVKLQST